LLAVPLVGLLARADPASLRRDLASADVLTALRLSLVCSLSATALALPIGVPLAWILARGGAPGLRWLRALVTLPIVLPPVPGGRPPVGGGGALLCAWGRRGLPGGWPADPLAVSPPSPPAGAILAETFVSMPSLVAAAEAGFRQVDRRYEEAAATLGATRLA